METEGAERLWKRSEKLGFRYVSVISDGDSKSFEHITSMKVYGDEVVVEKQECVNHVAKRIGTGLRNLLKSCSAKKITLGGKADGSLKGTTIAKLTKYYRNAIVSNLEDTDKMRVAIFSTLDHCRSTDDNPLHGNCPSGSDSWCFYQRDLSNKVTPRKHSDCIKTPLNKTVYEYMLPLYKRLSTEQLLKRCALGLTQNANESLHGLIWSKCPKVNFTAKRRVDAAVGEGICVYNEGYMITMSSLLQKARISPGRNTIHFAEKKDLQRLRLRNVRSSEKYRKYRKLVKAAQLAEEERKRAREGNSYGAGQF